MKSLRERRHEHTLAAIAKQLEKRDLILAQLCRVQTKLAEFYRQRDRYERIEAKTAPLTVGFVKGGDTIEQANKKAEAIAVADDCSIPDFLQRQRDGLMRDKIAADAIRAEQEERKRNKARVRIEEMKAKQSGASKRMPLQGKDALKAIYE